MDSKRNSLFEIEEILFNFLFDFLIFEKKIVLLYRFFKLFLSLRKRHTTLKRITN